MAGEDDLGLGTALGTLQRLPAPRNAGDMQYQRWEVQDVFLMLLLLVLVWMREYFS